jgi:hypothetical protein
MADGSEAAESIGIGSPAPDSAGQRIESLIEYCYHIADQIQRQPLADRFRRIAATAERTGSQPTIATMELLRARFARPYFAAAEAGELQLPEGLQPPATPKRPSDPDDCYWAALGIALLLHLSRDPELDSNPLALAGSGRESAMQRSSSEAGIQPPAADHNRLQNHRGRNRNTQGRSVRTGSDRPCLADITATEPQRPAAA